jgi:NAD(P)-dependent dehydrogenase (short-subunit alcohol dehydrogenase family)
MTGRDEAVDVVIGGASGMGAAVAARIKGPRRMILADKDAHAAERVAASLGRRVDAVGCDITDPAGCVALASKVGRLASLVMTAGLSPTMARGERIFDVNLVGTARVLHAFDDAVGEGTTGVLFSSTAAHMLVPSSEVATVLDDPLAPDLVGRLRAAGVDASEPAIAYAFSKAGVIRLVRRTAPSWWARGARILSLSPGIIDTPMGRQELEHQPVMKGMVDVVGRLGTAEEVSAVVRFLLSDGASLMTGSDVLVDGGIIALTSGAR